MSAVVEPHVYPCRVRWSDIDSYGHVNNVMYFEYFQEARIAFLSGFSRVSGARTLVVARQVVDYKVPMLFRDPAYPIHTWVTRRGTSSFTLTSQIRDGDRLVATAETVIVAFDGDAQRSRPLDDAEVEALDAMLL
jgi:acyl-CoA thioester hydrolase